MSAFLKSRCRVRQLRPAEFLVDIYRQVQQRRALQVGAGALSCAVLSQSRSGNYLKYPLDLAQLFAVNLLPNIKRISQPWLPL